MNFWGSSLYLRRCRVWLFVVIQSIIMSFCLVSFVDYLLAALLVTLLHYLSVATAANTEGSAGFGFLLVELFVHIGAIYLH